MQNNKNILSERLLNFGVKIIKLSSKLNESYAERHIANQLIRSATSSGANYEEACSAESKADFIHKMQIVLKESFYWLKLLHKAEIITNEEQGSILTETEELIKIVAKSVITSKGLRK
jgi:four helix bundle protein